MRTLPIEQIQLEKLNRLLAEVWERNPFYTRKWTQAAVTLRSLSSLADLAGLPLTTREEFLADQFAHPPLGTNLTQPFNVFKRFQRSSGTTRAPLYWADTAESWQWLLTCSHRLFLVAGITLSDRLFFTMPFGSSLGPWIIYEGAELLGCGSFTTGSTAPGEQLRWLIAFQPTVLVGKPSLLDSLALAAETAGISPQTLGVAKLILTGEPSIDLRLPLEQRWNARAFDRYGLTEAGSVASECDAHSGGMHLLEEEFIAEVIHPETARPVSDGEPGELVLTNLGRWPRPIIRYRTGDLVRVLRRCECPCGRTGPFLKGGIKRKDFS